MATDKTSLARLEQLHPSIRQSAIDAYLEACEATPKGVHPVITETSRSFKRSDDLYAQGRTKSGSIVTNAKGGDSLHNYDLAIDFANEVNGTINWKVDAEWMKVVNIFKKHGWKWGGDFKSIKDYPHLENTNGLTLSQIKQKYKQKDFISGTQYINLDNSVNTEPTETGVYTTTSDLNLRKGSGTNYEVLETLKKGTDVQVLDVHGDWSHVYEVVDDNVGYVSSKYLIKK
jgi:peptidoglycan L-alanyl-D-glutamate endopeptidase CwlK